MRVTPTMMRVLRAVERHEGCGANLIASVMWPDTHRHMSLRAGQYMGRLRSKGLIHKSFDEYRGKHGQLIIASVSYNLTRLAREILKSDD